MRIRIFTSTPLNVAQGSGTFTAVQTLVEGLQAEGAHVQMITPKQRLPVFTAERLIFNRWIGGLEPTGYDVSVGIDLDGYLIAGVPGRPHVACIKGVIADELQWERGITRQLLSIQARWEKRHVERASAVVVPSRYSAARIHELYGVGQSPRVVPEPIDLDRWDQVLRSNPGEPDPSAFTVLAVCRFYRRKRIDVLLRAAQMLRTEIPNLRLRIVGDGPEDARLREFAWDLGVTEITEWLGTITQEQLARELQSCDVFCLPTVQESFGLVFLEAMAAARPIVAARAGAVPEVAPHALFAEPDDPQSLAHQLTIFAGDPKQRVSSGQEGFRRVRQYDVSIVAKRFLMMLEEVVAGG